MYVSSKDLSVMILGNVLTRAARMNGVQNILKVCVVYHKHKVLFEDSRAVNKGMLCRSGERAMVLVMVLERHGSLEMERCCQKLLSTGMQW